MPSLPSSDSLLFLPIEFDTKIFFFLCCCLCCYFPPIHYLCNFHIIMIVNYTIFAVVVVLLYGFHCCTSGAVMVEELIVLHRVLWSVARFTVTETQTSVM